MPTIKLTQLAVDRLQPATTNRSSPIYWDSQLPGFGVRVSPQGKKSWIAMYRVHGRSVMETLGHTGILPKVEDARKLARQSMLEAKQGINPVQERRAQQKAANADVLTLGRLADKFLSEYASHRYRASSLYQTKRLLGRASALWDMPAASIKRADIVGMLEDIASHRKRPMPGKGPRPTAEATNVMVALGTVYWWAISEELLEINPLASLRKNRFGVSVPRDRVLNDDEIVRFWDAMETIGWPYGPIGQLLLLTAQRRNEVAGLPWHELDLDERIWNLPRERTKSKRAHVIPLSRQAMAIIQSLPRIENRGGLVFPDSSGQKHVAQFDDGKRKANALMPGVPRWVWHDLRRTGRTLMSKCGIGADISRRVLNHKIGGIDGVYDRYAYLEEKKEALDKLGHYIELVVTPDE